MQDEFDGLDVVGDDDELGLVVLNECGDVVEALLEHERLLGSVLGLVLLEGFSLGLSISGDLGLGFGFGLLTGLLILLGLGRVLGEQLEELLGYEMVVRVLFFASRAQENWLMMGGTLSRFRRTRFCRWIRTYLGHFTYRVRSRCGWMSPPMRKFFGRATKSGFCARSFFFLSAPAVVTTFLPFVSFLGYPISTTPYHPCLSFL